MARHKKHKGTLCWDCAKATKGDECPWVRKFEPVPGWVAKKTIIEQSKGEYTDSYKVKECPLFKEG